MRTRRGDGRILIYSHDTFGLGHLRRCRTIAHSLVERFKQLSVLILSGSPIIGSFDFKARVDFVRVPGVVKLRNGEYTPLNLHLDIRETMAMRASIIQHTAEAFGPDMFIVDKEPVGLRGEVLQTLKSLKRRGTRLVLGLRDVMDEPSALAPEWERKKVLPALDKLYDELWVYGLPQICDPLEGIKVPLSVRGKMVYTGYLERSESAHADLPDMPVRSMSINGHRRAGRPCTRRTRGARHRGGRTPRPAPSGRGPARTPPSRGRPPPTRCPGRPPAP